MIREHDARTVPGLAALAMLLGLMAFAGYAGFQAISQKDLIPSLGWGLVELCSFVSLFGLFMVNPNEGRVLQLFGAYRGTVSTPGLRWANPFFTKEHIS